MICAGMLLAACGGIPRTAEPVRYDLGRPEGPASPVPLEAVDVQAASWLAGPAMHFRLAYAEPQRRQSYVESRWAAPPAELLETWLKRRMVFGQADYGGAGCRLRLTLDEFEQRFDEPAASYAIIEARAALAPGRGGEPLALRTFAVRKAAPTADARGGALAARDAAQALAADLGAWLGELARARPAVVERCRTI